MTDWEYKEWRERCQKQSKERLKKNNYVQRDLEDQIEEEYKSKGLTYKRTQMTTIDIPVINVNEVLELLAKGYTRLEKDDIGFGSIQGKFNLRAADVKKLFQHPSLKNKKRAVPGFVLADATTVTLPEVTVTTTSATPETDKLFS